MKASFALAAVIGLTSLGLTATASAAPAIAEGNGVVHTTGSAGGRRIFVDDRAVGQTPQSVTVKCGQHAIRLGSTGKSESFDVPCAGEINVSASLGEGEASATASASASASSAAPATTPASSAAQPPASAVAPPPAPAPATSAAPLQTLPTRPSHALSFAPASESTPIGYKIIAGVGVAAAAVLYALRRRKPAKKVAAKIDVLGRTSVGMRSELLVVDVEGTRLLVGMTPNAIQTLAVLETPDHTAFALADEAAEAKVRRPSRADDERSDDSEVRGRPAPLAKKTDAPPARASREIQALLAQRRSATRMPAVTDEMIAERREAIAAERPEPAPMVRRRSKSLSAITGNTSAVAGQARGLLLSMDEDAMDSDDVADGGNSKKPVRLGAW